MKELNVEKSFLSLSELLQAAPGKSSANSHAPFYKVSVPFPLAHPSTGLLMRISITRLRTLPILVRSDLASPLETQQGSSHAHGEVAELSPPCFSSLSRASAATPRPTLSLGNKGK